MKTLQVVSFEGHPLYWNTFLNLGLPYFVIATEDSIIICTIKKEKVLVVQRVLASEERMKKFSSVFIVDVSKYG